MMGVVNREYRQIIRSHLHPYNKWVVSYQEWPRNQVHIITRAANELSRRFHNHGKFSY